MQKTDSHDLAGSLNALAETLGKPAITPKALEVWFETLREFHTPDVLGLLKLWPKIHGKFPVPSEVWKTLNERAVEEREQRLKDEKTRRQREYERLGVTEHGKRCLTIIYDTLVGKEKPTPAQHWRKILETPGLAPISYEYARACLARLEPREVA